MEYFLTAKVVRLRSHSNKYLVAGHDGTTVRQSRDGNNRKARWTVEIVEHVGTARSTIRLQSCYGKYLAASDDDFLLGLTGKKAIQAAPTTEADVSVEWEPMREGYKVRLKARKGKFLRANKGPPPYKGSVTVDEPTKKGTKNWILWGVDILVTEEEWAEKRCNSGVSVFSECETQRFSTSAEEEEDDDDDGRFSVCSSFVAGDDVAAPAMRTLSVSSSSCCSSAKTWTELFRNAKTIRLRSRHDKYLIADEKQENVVQDRNGGAKHARWTVEYVKTGDGVQLVRFRSCFDKYLTAVDDPFLLGKTGKKVKQRIPRRLDSSVEWEPIRDGMQVKLKTRYGNYLRANGGVPPWRNSVTHDVPSSSHTQDWILWEVDVLEVYPKEEMKVAVKPAAIEEEEEDDGADPEPFMPSWMKSTTRTESSVRFPTSSAKNEGRAVQYNVVDDEGNVIDEGRPLTLNFKGYELEDLKQMLEEMTGLEDIFMCTRNPLNGKLYPLQLALPPQHVKMHVFVVPASSQAAGDLAGPTAS